MLISTSSTRLPIRFGSSAATSAPPIARWPAFIAAALAFGRVQSVLNSIEGMLAVMGPSPAAFVRGFEPARDRRAFDHLVHRWTRGADMAALVWVLHQMMDEERLDRRLLRRGPAARRGRRVRGLQSFSTRALALDRKAVYGATPAEAGGGLLFLAAFVGRRLQAPQPVPAVDGARTTGSIWACGRRVQPASVDRATRYPRDSRRAVPAADALQEPRLEDGRRHHGVAARARPRRSGEVRLFHLSPRHDERLRFREEGW